MNPWKFELPPDWRLLQKWGDGYACEYGRLRVIVDCEQKSDNNYWIHVSVSTKHETPTHEEMARVKKDFIGEDRYAYSVWPPKDKYVNIMKHCLHIWACLNEDGRILPEFSSPIPELGLKQSI